MGPQWVQQQLGVQPLTASHSLALMFTDVEQALTSQVVSVSINHHCCSVREPTIGTTRFMEQKQTSTVTDTTGRSQQANQ
jgi:hypothetical protein